LFSLKFAPSEKRNVAVDILLIYNSPSVQIMLLDAAVGNDAFGEYYDRSARNDPKFGYIGKQISLVD
jgi:hypothetical protein